ncbi:hypothetical protein AB1N83_012624 [Pleurotus pulmonarius]
MFFSHLNVIPHETPQTALLPEILKRIFELSTDSANRSNALVCKGWCEEALSVVWSDVDAHRLFALLAPMKLEDCERYFSRDLEDGDWDRFEVYSWRVRSLRFATHSFVGRDIRPARHPGNLSPTQPLLGAVVYIFCRTSWLYITPPSNTRVFPLFAHASVRTLEVHLEFGGRNVGLLACNIERFRCIIPHDPSWSTISSALRNLQSLKELTISNVRLDLDTFHTLASLPYLRSVTTCKLPADISATAKDSKVFPSNPFPSLEELDVHIDFPRRPYNGSQ